MCKPCTRLLASEADKQAPGRLMTALATFALKAPMLATSSPVRKACRKPAV